VEVRVPEPEDEVIPIPTTDSDADHERVRSSNDRDQMLERRGEHSEHNDGYDEAADGAPRPGVTRVVGE